jgi:hypothetical protein
MSIGLGRIVTPSNGRAWDGALRTSLPLPPHGRREGMQRRRREGACLGKERNAMAHRALNNQMTRVVRVNRKQLVETLKTNRAKHVSEFKAAMAGYKAAALKKVDEAFGGLSDRLARRRTEVTDNINSFTPETADAFGDALVILNAVVVNLKVPVSYAEAYGAAIDMAEFDTRDELELSGAEFQCFCRDVWDWSDEFRTTSTLYAAGR